MIEVLRLFIADPQAMCFFSVFFPSYQGINEHVRFLKQLDEIAYNSLLRRIIDVEKH